MKNLLYKRDKNGKLMRWEILYDDVSYSTQYGYVDGVLTITLPTFVNQKNVGKSNETSIKDQVLLEVKSKIQYQLDHGYSYEIPEIEKPFAVSLAEKYIDRVEKNKLSFPYICQPKYDGVRCSIRKENGTFVMKSRANKDFVACPHIVMNEFIFNLFKKYPDMILDGELYNHELKDNFNKIVSIVKKVKLNIKDIEKSEKLIKYYIFDVYFIDKPDLTYTERNKILQDAFYSFADFSGCEYYEMVYDFNSTPFSQDTKLKYVAYNENDVEHYIDEFVNDGYEGIMLKKDVPYFFGRSFDMLKYKRFKDEEYPIVDIEEGKGNLKGIASAIICKADNGTEFKAGIIGTQEYAKNLFENKSKYFGKLATVKYQELTPVKNGKGGVPRFGKVTTIRDYE